MHNYVNIIYVAIHVNRILTNVLLYTIAINNNACILYNTPCVNRTN